MKRGVRRSIVKNRKNKSGFMEMSFGMIFSIILIIVFLILAFYGIKKLLEVQETAMVAQFKSDLQEDVNKMWNGAQGQQSMTYKLPKKIVDVCFRGAEAAENLYFLPIKSGFSGTFIEHIDITEETCFRNNNGEIVITLKKDFGESLVTLK